MPALLKEICHEESMGINYITYGRVITGPLILLSAQGSAWSETIAWAKARPDSRTLAASSSLIRRDRSPRDSGKKEYIISNQKAMQKRDDQQIKREYWLRQGRQFLAIAVALFLVLLTAVVYKRQDLFGEYSKNTLVAVQLMVITAFIGFTAFNWRCPSCRKYLGSDIYKRACRHCKTRLR